MHDLVARRVERLSTGGRELVKAAAVAGTELLPDVLAEVCGDRRGRRWLCWSTEGVRAGVLVTDAPRAATDAGSAHDLFREAIYRRLAVPQRMALHQRIADALEHRHARGGAVGAGRPGPALRGRGPAGRAPSGRSAGPARRPDAERARLGLRRGRRAPRPRPPGDGGRRDAQAGGPLVDLLVEEADARARAGDSPAARGAAGRRRRTGRPRWRRRAARPGRAGRAAARRPVRDAPRRSGRRARDRPCRAARQPAPLLEAQLTASLARELHHSVPAQRARARPLSERALALARTLDDPATLAACLLARHDVLWTPGRAAERVDLAREIADLAARTGDAERHAEGLLLTANALLEEGRRRSGPR